jgi:hypothetical protein
MTAEASIVFLVDVDNTLPDRTPSGIGRSAVFVRGIGP